MFLVQSVIQDETWAAYMMNKKNVNVPVGDACKVCRDLHFRFFAYLNWQELCKLSSNGDAGSEAVEQARKFMDDPSQRQFLGEEVAQTSRVCIEISKVFGILNKSEYKATFGRDPMSKVKSPTLEVMSESGIMEKVWLFQHDATWAGRTAKISSISDVSRAKLLMERADHAHEHQGQHIFEYGNTNRRTESCEAILSGNTVIPTIKDIEEKLRACASQVKSAGKTAPSDVKESTGEMSSSSDQDVRPAAVPALMRKQVPLPSQASNPKASASLSGSKLSSAGWDSEATSGGKGPVSEARSSAGGDDDDDAPGISPEQKWTKKVNLQALMRGEALGRQIRYATEAADKLTGMPQVIIKAHLKLAPHTNFQVLSRAS
jgi:hypothetical protein